MDIWAAYASALSHFGDPTYLAYLFIGIISGLVVGILPGIGSEICLAVVLPFVFMMDQYNALAMMMGMCATQFIGGAVTAILLGVPGTVGNMATVLDGYELAKQGQADRAIGAAVTASLLGKLGTFFFTIILIPLVVPFVMIVTSKDMVFVVLLGVIIIGALSRGSMLKGVISGLAGLTLSLVGIHAITGASRFTYGTVYLHDGLPIIPAVLGIFAMAEMVSLAASGGSIAKIEDKHVGKGRGKWLGARDALHHWKLTLRSAIIGYIVGIIPGIGAGVAIWVGYGQAKMTSKYPEKFGTGVIEGVIAPEAACNAKEEGALLTTLALGIPGSMVYVFILAAFIMLGLSPGPKMITEHLDLALNLIIVIIAASFIAGIVVFFSAQHLAKIARIPARILVPWVSVIIMIGAFAYRQDFTTMVIVVIFTFIGVLMKEFGFSRPALALGWMLGIMLEKYFFLALGAQGRFFWLAPGPIVMTLITIILFTYGPAKKGMFKRSDKKKILREIKGGA